MLKLQRRSPLYAGMLLSPVLLAATPTLAQEMVRSGELPQSILSLAPSPKPQGYLLARRAGDATFDNAPANYHVFAAATVGQDAGVEVLTLNFAAEAKLTRIASKNKDFVVEPGGTCVEGNSYARGASCTLLVRFNPQGPGHRLGFIDVANTADATPMSFGLTGSGYAPVVSFTPSIITTVPASISSGTGTISSSTSLAIDGGDLLYIADTGNNKMKKMDSTGAITDTANSPIATPASAAADSFGIIYTANTAGSTYYFSVYYPWGSETAFGYAHTAGTCTPSAPCAFSAVGMSSPANVSMDNYDNLFFEEGTKGAAEMPVASISGGDGAFNLWYLSDQFSYSSGSPGSFAVDAYGNLYTKYSFTSAGMCYLLEESLYNAEYSPTATRVAGGAACGFSGDGGPAGSAEISSSIGQIAFDVYGNLYFADAGNQRVRRIDAATGFIHTIAGNGTAGYSGDGGGATGATLSNPTGVAVDSQGRVYILSNAPTAGPTQVLRKVGVAGLVNYGSQVRGTASSTRVVTVANTGNDTLILSKGPFFNGSDAGDFSIDPSATSCVLTTGATLALGQSCKIGIVFKPAATGSRSADLVFEDNTINGINLVQLSGTGALPAPTMSITSPTTTTSLTQGVAFTFAVSVTSTSSTKPTGTMTFKSNGTVLGSPVTLSTSGTASTSVTESKSGSYTLSAVYSGDANFATDTVSESVTVAAIKVPVSVNLMPAVQSAFSCGAAGFAVQVSAKTGGSPTGTVELMGDSTVLGSATLQNGAATLSPHALPPGSHTIVARYSGDSTHEAATSSAVVMTVPSIGGSCGGGLQATGNAR